jgi:hypothetical protein
MTQWEEKTLFQQLAIILSIICGRLLVYWFAYAFNLSITQVLVGIVFITVFPSIFAYLTWQVITKLKENKFRGNAGHVLPETADVHPPTGLLQTHLSR